MDFAIVANPYTCGDKAILPKGAVVSDLCIFHDVAEMPDGCATSNLCTGVDAGGFMNFGGHGVGEEGKLGKGEKGKIRGAASFAG